jgi:hypothetical protein
VEVKLNGYSATIDIYHEQKGYVCGGLNFCRNICDLQELIRYQEFLNNVITSLIYLNNDVIEGIKNEK